MFDLKTWRRDRKMGSPQGCFAQGYTLPSLTYNGHYDEIPYAFEGQLCQNKAPAGLSADLPAIY